MEMHITTERGNNMPSERMLSERLVSLTEFCRIIGICKVKYFYSTNPDHPRYNPDMPKGVKIGGYRNSRIFFRKSDVDAYVDKLVGIVEQSECS